jgi:hypothetical protein
MWAAALYVVGGAIVAFGVWIFGFGTGQQNRRLNCALWVVAAGVLWPLLLLGVIEAVVIVGVFWCARRAHFHLPRPIDTFLTVQTAPANGNRAGVPRDTSPDSAMSSAQ